MANRAEFRFMKSFEAMPGRNKVEFAENKIKAYLDMYNEPLSSQAIATIRTLAGMDRMAKLTLPRWGIPRV